MVLVHQINGNKWGHWFGDQQGSAGDLLWWVFFPEAKLQKQNKWKLQWRWRRDERAAYRK